MWTGTLDEVILRQPWHDERNVCLLTVMATDSLLTPGVVLCLALFGMDLENWHSRLCVCARECLLRWGRVRVM